MIILTAILSWLGSIYGWGCRNLIDEDGLRWFVAHFMDNIIKGPIEYILLFDITIGTVVESEIFNFRRKKIYLKQKRAYMIVMVICLLILTSVFIMNILPGNLLLTAFGQFHNSPLQKGLIPLIALFFILMALVFGYASGRFSNFQDMSKAMTSVIVRTADYFTTFIIAAQLFAILDFTMVDSLGWTNDSSFIKYSCYFILFYCTWFFHLTAAYKKYEY